MTRSSTFRSKLASSLLSLLMVCAPLSALAAVTPGSTGLDAAAQGTGLDNACEGAEAQVCIARIVGSVITAALGFVEVLLFIYLLYGGFLWMTSGGDSEGVKKAKTMIKNAVIGLIIIALSYVLASFIITRLGTAINPAPAPAGP